MRFMLGISAAGEGQQPLIPQAPAHPKWPWKGETQDHGATRTYWYLLLATYVRPGLGP